jgi:class 3 adenylate cyclase
VDAVRSRETNRPSRRRVGQFAKTMRAHHFSRRLAPALAARPPGHQHRGEDIGGTAVNVAARVVESAEDSEVLVTSSARDAAAGSGIRFSQAGSYELKVLAERYQLYRAERD